MRFLLALLLVTLCRSQQLYDDTPSEYEEDTVLEHTNGDGRVRRMAEDFPDYVNYTFSLQGETKSFNLQRNKYVPEYVALTVLRGGQPRRLTGYEHDFSKSAYYIDERNSAAVFLHCENLEEKCNMHGSFYSERKRHIIQPSSKEGLHQIKRVAEEAQPLEYGNDVKKSFNFRNMKDALRYRPKYPTAVQHHIVELTMFLDDTCYKYFMDKYNGDSWKALMWTLKFYGQMANEMHWRYRSIVQTYPYFEINIYLKEIVVAETLADCPWMIPHLRLNGTQVERTVIEEFAQWQHDNQKSFLTYDHAMGLTRRDMTSGGSTGLLGIAAGIGTTCSDPKNSATMSESFGTNVPSVLTHELGHTLGGWHDGTGGCNDEDALVMSKYLWRASPEVTFNVYFFSDCSVKQFLYHLQGLPPSDMCTLDPAYTASMQEKIKEQLEITPAGIDYNVNEQCQFAFGDGSRFRGDIDDSICEFGLKCTRSSNNGYVYPFLRTTCGKDKKCLYGRCVYVKKENNMKKKDHN